MRDRLIGDVRREWAKEVSDELHAELDADVNDWRSWTWRRSRSAHAAREVQLAKIRARDEQQQLARAAVVSAPTAAAAAAAVVTEKSH